MTVPTARAQAAAGMAFALGGAVFYGVNIAYVRMAADAGVTGALMVAWRVLLMAGLAALFAAALSKGLAEGLSVPRKERSAVLATGISSAAVALCYITSVAFVPVTVAAVIFYTFPVLIVLATPFVEKRPLTPAMIGIVLVAFAGVVLVVGPALGGLDPFGTALAFGASVAAVWQFFAAARAPETSAVAKIFWIQLVMLPAAAAAAWALGGSLSPAIFTAAPFAVFMTIGLYVVAFVFHMAALTRIAPSAAGLAFCAEPLVAAISSAVLLDERVSALQYAGGTLVIAAIVANVRIENRAAASSSNAPSSAAETAR